jgi:hypothetical protein
VEVGEGSRLSVGVEVFVSAAVGAAVELVGVGEGGTIWRVGAWVGTAVHETLANRKVQQASRTRQPGSALNTNEGCIRMRRL